MMTVATLENSNFCMKIIYNHLALVEKKTLRFNPFMHNVVKWLNIL